MYSGIWCIHTVSQMIQAVKIILCILLSLIFCIHIADFAKKNQLFFQTNFVFSILVFCLFLPVVSNNIRKSLIQVKDSSFSCWNISITVKPETSSWLHKHKTFCILAFNEVVLCIQWNCGFACKAACCTKQRKWDVT